MLCGAPPPPPRAGAPGGRGGVALRLVPRSLRGEVPKEAGGPVNYGRGRPWPQGPPGREKEPRSQVHAAKEPARRLPSHSSGTSSQAPALLGAADTLLWLVAVVTTRDPQIPDSSAGLGPPSAAWSAHICSLLPHRPLWPCGVRGARWPPTGCPRRARPLGGGASRTRHTAVTGEGVAPWSRPAGQHWPVDPEPGSAGQHWPRSGLHRPHHCDLLCPLPEPGPDEQAGGFLKPTRSPPAQGPRPAHALVPVETEQLFFCSKKEEGRREGEGASLRADVGVLGAPPNPCHGDVKGTVGLEAGNDPAPRLACADTTGLTRFPLPPPAGVGGRRVWPEQQLLTLLGISRLCRGP